MSTSINFESDYSDRLSKAVEEEDITEFKDGDEIIKDKSNMSE